MDEEIKITRASSAGEHFGNSIIEMVNLMYQNKTAINFLKKLVLTITNELIKRESKKELENESRKN